MCLFCPECVLNEGDAAEPGPRRGREQRFVTSACNRFRAVSRGRESSCYSDTKRKRGGVASPGPKKASGLRCWCCDLCPGAVWCVKYRSADVHYLLRRLTVLYGRYVTSNKKTQAATLSSFYSRVTIPTQPEQTFGD